ncbi:MAG: 2Fe-2S iron-sulfur cluster-binding protein, partial [Anaerolineales bacterium]
MEVTLKILRYNPETDKKPHYETYKVEAERNDQVLDLLNRVKWYQDGTLSYRRSCAHGVCGSDAVRINGVNRLACKVLVRDVGTKITIEPILGLAVK